MQVAYHDVPDKAYEVFLGAITSKYLEQRLVIPSLVEAHNPAGKFTFGVLIVNTCTNTKAEQQKYVD